MLHNTTAIVLITLGFMTFGVWRKQDSGTAGAENLGHSRESSPVIKSEERYSILVSNCGVYPLKQVIFVMLG